MRPPGLVLLQRLPGYETIPPPGSPAWVGVDAWMKDLAAFALRIYSVILPVLLVLSWPTDWMMFADDPRARLYFAEWRALSIALLAPLAVLSWRWSAVERHPIAAFSLSCFVGGLWTAWCNGRVGSFDTPWPYYLYFGIGVILPVPTRPRHRLLVIGGIALSIFVGFCLLHPENLRHPQMPHAMLFLFHVVWFNLVVGEVVWTSAVVHYFDGLRLREATRSLAELNQTLDQRVREQTTELRELSRHLVQAQETERNRLAAELHDDLGQQLAAARFLMSASQQAGPERASAALAEVHTMLGTASASVRTLVSTLRPLLLEQLGLTAACENLTRTMGNAADLGYDYAAEGALDALPLEVSVTVYRVLQEALTNVTKHARASSVEVELKRTPAGVELVVRDDGRGLEPGAARADGGGLGLVGMRERAHAVAGELRVGPAEGEGTTLMLRIPLEVPS